LGTEPVDYIVDGDTSTQGIGRDSNYLYITDAVPQSLRVLTDVGLPPVVGPPIEIGIASLQVAQIPIGTTPGEVLVDDPNNRVYVTNTGSDDISVIDTNLLTEISRISISGNLPSGVQAGDQPFGMTLVNIGGVNYLYVANFNSNNISVINADAMSVVAAFPPVPTPIPQELPNNGPSVPNSVQPFPNTL
jgi:YVTN family beta-propeller protein